MVVSIADAFVAKDNLAPGITTFVFAAVDTVKGHGRILVLVLFLIIVLTLILITFNLLLILMIVLFLFLFLLSCSLFPFVS